MRLAVLVTTLAAAAGCKSSGAQGVDGGGGDEADAPEGALTLPPANAGFDYQLGGAYPPPDGTSVVARDRTEAPAPGAYNICYVNGFQTQPGEGDWWLSEHPELILRDEGGDPVIDPGWPDEMLLDVTTPEKRAAIAAVVGGWIDGCGDDGFQAVEIDNPDTYSRSGGRISPDDAVATAALFTARAHGRALAIAQKNSLEIIDRHAEMGFDFAVAEECNRYDECAGYVEAYGDLVFVIEYDDSSFAQGCSDFPSLSLIRRDLGLSTPASPEYRFDGC
jgi:hypothetical protein